MSGFVKVDRSLLQWEWKDVPEMVALWINILLQANYKDYKWHGKVYEKGSFPTSLDKLSRETGLSLHQIRTCLKRLKKAELITVESGKEGTKIIVNDFNTYQGGDDDVRRIHRKSEGRKQHPLHY